jgi:7,8-dihydropterin-6-yl-methyl-4-(beta-D-ribofuranosyl)aminobenzene 5'-phosphate synthase
VKIAALVENDALTGSPVGSEHGLALMIEVDGRQILFDTGASGLLVRNARALGLDTPLSHLDAIVLSHGHYDHTGGLVAVLGETRASVPVVVRPGLFERKVRDTAGVLRDIGMPVTRRELEERGARFVEDRLPADLLPGTLLVTGEIALRESWEDVEPGLSVQRPDGRVEEDPFDDEQALAIRTERGIVVFVGCAHRGLVNSVAAARRAAGDDRVRAVFGGAHLRSASNDRIERTVAAVVEMQPEFVVLGHCTGREAEDRFARALGERFQPLRAGACWTV